MTRFWLVCIAALCAVYASIAVPSSALAANYAPSLSSPMNGTTGVACDYSDFSWAINDQPEYFVIQWATDSVFSSNSTLFSYEVSGNSYKVSGLPGGMTLYWRVIGVYDNTQYSSSTWSFETSDDGEGFVNFYSIDDEFDSFNSSTWSRSGNTSYLRYHSTYKCMYAYNSTYSYTNAKGYLTANDKVSVPEDGGANVIFDFSCYGYSYYTVTLACQYSTDGSSWSDLWKKSGAALDSGSRSYSSSPGAWKTVTLDLPESTYGEDIYIRFYFTHGRYGPDCWLDNVQYRSKKYIRRLTVSSDHGSPSPDGTTELEKGDTVGASAPLHISYPQYPERRYLCVGWEGTGSVPVYGQGNSLTFTIYRSSSIFWQWQVEYRVSISSTNNFGSPTPSGDVYFLKGSKVTFSANKVESTGDPQQRYALFQWSGTGCCSGSGTENVIEVTVDSPGTLMWEYRIQYALEIFTLQGSDGFDPPIGTDNWYFENAVVLATCPDFIDGGNGEGYVYESYDMYGDIEPEQYRPVTVRMTEPAGIWWQWSEAYYLQVNSPYGTVQGDASGWYASGATINTSVNEYEGTENDEIRWYANGWTASGSVGDGSGNIIPAFDIYEPTTVTLTWNREFRVEFATNAGTTTPGTGWITEGDTVPIDATPPPDTADTRYFFDMWTGSGVGSYSGVNKQATITVLEPINQYAQWRIQYTLTVIAINGGLDPDPSGWYDEGSNVSITATPEAAADGMRWRAEWFGTGEGVATIEPSNNSPSTVNIVMLEPSVQRVQWHRQYRLTIENPQGYGFCHPAPGSYWYFEGTTASGYCKYTDGNNICTGYDATGAFTGGSQPWFSQLLDGTATVSWNWGTRPDSVDSNWVGFVDVANFNADTASLITLDDGTLVAYFFSTDDGTIKRAILVDDSWVTATVLANPGMPTFLSATAMEGSGHVVYYDSEDSTLKHYYDEFGDAKWDGLQAPPPSITITDLGVAGLRPSAATYQGTLWISYFDADDASLKVLETEDGDNWTTHVIDVTDGAGFFNAIKVQQHDGMPVVAFARGGGSKGLFFARYDGENWLVETVMEDFTGFFCSLALDAGDVPHISYQSLDSPEITSLHCVYYDGTGWVDELVDDSGLTGYNTSIYVDDGGFVHIAYHDGSDLYYAFRGLDGWFIRRLVEGGVGGETGITVKDGYPAILFMKDGKVSYIDGSGDQVAGGGGGTGGGTDEDSGGGGGGCFVATAAFGSLAASDVAALTSFRDCALANTHTGSELVSLYYCVSPEAAQAMADSNALRALVRTMLR
ncbi:MAG: CFI-box-CTERM domain-containing protein [Planctomycetota bacterium]|nr:CFI-box-CTERM domain-containing protein [Planctomycetota bacterium]